MIDEIIASYAATLDLIRRSVSDLPNGQWVAQPTGAPNHPAWTLGHLVHSAQAIGGELGMDPWLPETWKDTFGTGSMPVPDPHAYPLGAELIAAFDSAQERVQARLRSLDPQTLAGPLPDVRYRDVFPSLGHAVLHILCAHTSCPGGPIMLWRRALGLGTEAAL
ncbi:MAG: DinB family protein [Planctomycetota bacterium]|nr:DinB family protein [Planctomycetota bacterium]